MDDTALVEVLIDMWDGQEGNWGHTTKSSGNVEIKNPWLNLLACTTPSWLEQNFPTRHDRRRPDVPCDVHLRGQEAPPRGVPRLTSSGGRLQCRSNSLSSKTLNELLSSAEVTVLSPAARRWGEHWYARLWSARPANMANDRYSGYLSRKQTHIHKLAIVLAASQRDKLIIEEAEPHRGRRPPHHHRAPHD